MNSKILILTALLALVQALPHKQSNGTQISPRIIDGEFVSKMTFYEVAIMTDEQSPKICTGVLIRSDWVLTSAYCVKNKPVLKVSLGSNYPMIPGRIVDKIIIHPYYNPLYLQHDIALLWVQAGRDTPYTSTVALPNPPIRLDEYVGQTGIISGFGAYGSNSNNQINYLSSKSVNVIENALCQNVGHFMSNYKLCTAGRAVCEGDQGSPLVVGSTVIGIASAALHLYDCENQVATSYTRVNYYRSWIDQTIAYHCRC